MPLTTQLQALVRANDQRMGEMRLAVESRLAAIQHDNEKKLEQMRATVDEKLHATLEHAARRKLSSGWPNGSSRCTAASARCKSSPATSAP